MLVDSIRTLTDLSPLIGQHYIDISFKNLTYEVPIKSNSANGEVKTILHGVSGIFKAG